jgi:hypothetical protein
MSELSMCDGGRRRQRSCHGRYKLYEM